jgi:hypothetical protein
LIVDKLKGFDIAGTDSYSLRNKCKCSWKRFVGVRRVSLLFSLTLNEKRNLFIFIGMFSQSDCMATVEHNTLHSKAETNRAVYWEQIMISNYKSVLQQAEDLSVVPVS